MSKDIEKRDKKRRKIQARLNHVAIVSKGANNKEFFLFKRADSEGKIDADESKEQEKKVNLNNMTKSELRKYAKALEIKVNENSSGGNEDMSTEQKKKLSKEDEAEDEDEQEETEETEEKEEVEEEASDDKDEKEEVVEEEVEEEKEEKPVEKPKKKVPVKDEEVTGQSQVLLSKPDYDKLTGRITDLETFTLALEELITGGKDKDKK